MSLQNRSLGSNLRHTSLGGAQSASGPSPMLVARINEKKMELENLKELRDLSAGLATQMQALEDKLSTLSDGAEAVAAVLSNWHNVMQAMNMASMKIPKAAVSKDEDEVAKQSDLEVPLPQTLVRIPVEPEPQAEKAKADDGIET